MSLKRLLKEGFVPKGEIEDIQNILDREGIPIGGELDYFINKGANGKVFKIKDKDKVLKIESFLESTYDQNADMMEINSDNIVNIFYLRHLPKHKAFISVMEYLEPIDGKVNYTEDVFRLIIVKLEPALNKKYVGYKNINMVEKKRVLLHDLNDKDLFEKLVDTFSVGDDSLIRALVALLSRWSHNVENMDQIFKDLINNKKFIFDIYYGIQDMMDHNFYHNDINMLNVLFDPKSNNFKIIDPWMEL